MEAWGFEYKTAAFVWVKKNMQSGKLYWGMGAYTRANAEICLLGISPRFSAKKFIKSHSVHQVIESPHEKHSKKPDAVRKKIDQLLGNVTKIELFARQRIDGWDAWGDEMTEEKGASDTSLSLIHIFNMCAWICGISNVLQALERLIVTSFGVNTLPFGRVQIKD